LLNARVQCCRELGSREGRHHQSAPPRRRSGGSCRAAPSPQRAPGAAFGGTVQPTPGAAPAVAQAVAVIDVAAILDKTAKESKQKLDRKHSIVDLMKLVGMDCSLSGRRELAADLKYSGDTDDTATMNVWLHKEVMKTLKKNGGKGSA
jgi:hypothetical protein